MLVLSRREGERIIIKCKDVSFSFTIQQVIRNKVRIAFDAPKDVIINREEVETKKKIKK